MKLLLVILVMSQTCTASNIINLQNDISHTFGKIERALGTLKYSVKNEKALNLVFNIDKFPYAQTIDLCPNLKENQVVVGTDANGKHITASLDCDSVSFP